MIYVCSDIHGWIERYNNLLGKINFTENDRLIILGDVIDRKDNGLAILLDSMKRDNIMLIMGNHEKMMLDTIEAIPENFGELTVDKLKALPIDTQDMIASWCGENGGLQTLSDFLRLTVEEKYELSDYLAFLPLYKELNVGGKDYVLIHGGLGADYKPEKHLVDYEEDDLVWSRTDYERIYYKDKILITGHTPTQYIKANSRPNYIYKGNNNIALDCGCGLADGQLGCICLDTMEEFYVN